MASTCNDNNEPEDQTDTTRLIEVLNVLKTPPVVGIREVDWIVWLGQSQSEGVQRGVSNTRRGDFFS